MERSSDFFLRLLSVGLEGDLVQPSGEQRWLRVQAVAESAGQTPGSSFLPSKPQVADTVTSLAGNTWRHHSRNHSFAPIKQSSPSRMPRKPITTKLPVQFESLATCRHDHDHNVWLPFFAVTVLGSVVTVGLRTPVMLTCICLEAHTSVLGWIA